jgi:predicted dehydrogenase
MVIRAGVVGAGILGSQHAAFLAAQPEVQLVGVADVRSEAAERLAGQLGVGAFNSVEELLANCLDLVTVATPDALHLWPCLAAIEAGVPNIIEEKPLATTLAEGQQLVAAVERHGTRLFVNYANRAATLDVATGYVLQQGLLGELVYAEARLDDNISVPTQMWGGRSRDWAAGSSTAHFLLSHVVDLLHWYLAPARVVEVYAIAQNKVLGVTPDLYDAFLTFDTGVKVRVKAEWIKHIDELVEFYMCFSGSEGTLVYNKRGGFGTAAGWRANLSASLTLDELLAHRQRLVERGVQTRAIVHRPTPMTATLAAGGATDMLSLEYQGLGYGDTMALCRAFVDAILQGTLTPSSWKGHGPLPTHVDGWRQTQVICAIIDSANTGRVVAIEE